MASTAFERYGGFASINRIVMSFYDRVLDSDVIGDFFAEVDMRRLIDHQTKFICQAMGGPVAYTDQHLRQVHAHLEIGQAHFEEMVALMRDTLEEFSISADDVDKVIAEIERRRPYVVTVP